jgi:hypothetical protein
VPGTPGRRHIFRIGQKRACNNFKIRAQSIHPPRFPTMPKPPTKNRKRRNAFTTQPTGFSKSLGAARNLISLGQNDQGLAVLNQLATTTKNPKRRAKILMLVGESQAKLHGTKPEAPAVNPTPATPA